MRHRGIAEAPATLTWTSLIVPAHPAKQLPVRVKKMR